MGSQEQAEEAGAADSPVDANPSIDEGTGGRAQRRHARMELLKEAAIQAEYATGEQEDTEEKARRHVAIRIGTIVVGFIVLIAGLIMLVLPGQGILTVIAGLAILSRELAWAERVLEYAKKRAKLDELKTQPVWVKAVVWTFTGLAIAASLWWMFVADPRPQLADALPWNW